MTPLVDELLAIAWPDGVPARLDAIIDRVACEQRLGDFKLGLIFPLDEQARAVRLALSDAGETQAWRRGVLERWPSELAEDFIGAAPVGARMMVDSDGSERAVLYLDDLQEHAHGFEGPAGQQLMSLTLSLPEGQRGAVSRHPEPPSELLGVLLAERLAELLALGAEGLWALRWQGDEVQSRLWISESRWRGNPNASRAVLARLGACSALDATLGCLLAHGRQGYPDAVELDAEGRAEVTLGVV